MKYNKEEKGISICLQNEKLPFDDYFIGSRNYLRRIDDLDAKKGKNGFGLLGSFEDKQSTILFDDILYLSCCRESGEKDTYHLFTIKKGEFKLLKTSKAQKGAVRTMWSEMEDFLAQRPKKSLQQLFNIIIAEETDKHRLHEFAVALNSYALGFEFDNQYSLPKSKKEQFKQFEQETIQNIKKEAK